MMTETIKRLQDEAKKLLADMRALNDACIAEKRGFTSEEQAKYDAMDVRYDEVNKEISRLVKMEEREKYANATAVEHRVDQDMRGGGGDTRAVRTDDGVLLLSPEQRAVEVGGFREPPFDRDAVLRCMLRNDWSGHEAERRALSADWGAAGGFAVGEFWAAEIVDAFRAQSTLTAAGASTAILTAGDTLHIARLETDPSITWHLENVQESATSATFKSVEAKLRTPTCLVQIPAEAAEASNIVPIINRAMSGALAAAIDAGGLTGAGAAGAPRGILNDADITNTDISGAPNPISNISAALLRLENKDVALQNLALISSPAWSDVIRKRLDGEGLPYQWPPWWTAIRQYSTTAISATDGDASNETSLILGDFSNVTVVVDSKSMRLEASRVAGTSFQSLQVWLRIYGRTDIIVTRPKGLEIISGIQV